LGRDRTPVEAVAIAMAGQACGEMGDDLRSVFDHRTLARLLGDGAIAFAVVRQGDRTLVG
jgi:hypothetical protein